MGLSSQFRNCVAVSAVASCSSCSEHLPATNAQVDALERRAVFAKSILSAEKRGE